MLRVVKNVAVILDKMVLFEGLGLVPYSHSIATMTASFAVSTQYTNVTDSYTRNARPRLCIASRGKTAA